MLLGSADILIDALRQSTLLRSDYLERLESEIGPKFEDPQELAKHIVRLGWITLYQAKKLLAGHGDDLILGHYVISEKIGEGGMGKVYKAKQLRLNRTVALKVVRPDLLSNDTAMKRFDREAKSAAQLNHPNIVRLFDADQVGDRHFLAMEFVEGIDLAQRVKDQGPQPLGVACSFIRQAATALHYAHELGLVHRDIKPSNILVTSPSKTTKGSTGGVIKILDMGLARAVVDDESESALTALTQDGAVIGTPDFMSPEQAKNSSTVDGRSDLYSLGCTFYFLLTGQSPFPEGSALEKLLQHQMDQPRHIQLLRQDVPHEVAGIVHKLLAKRASDRFQTGAALATALEPWSVFDTSGESYSVKNTPASDTPKQPMPRTNDAELFAFDAMDAETVPPLITAAETKPKAKHNPAEAGKNPRSSPMPTFAERFHFDQAAPAIATENQAKAKSKRAEHEPAKKSRMRLWIMAAIAVVAMGVGCVFAVRHFDKSDQQSTSDPNPAGDEPKSQPLAKKDSLLPPLKKGELEPIETYLPADTDIVAVLNVQQLNKSKFFRENMLPALADFVDLFRTSVSMDPFRLIDRVVIAIPSGNQGPTIVLSGRDFVNPMFLKWVGSLPGVTKTQEMVAGIGPKEIYFLPGKKDAQTGKQEDMYGAVLSNSSPMTIVLSGRKECVINALARTGPLRSEVTFDDPSIKPMLARYSQKPSAALWVSVGVDTKLFAAFLDKKFDRGRTPKENGVHGMIASLRLTDVLSLDIDIEAKSRPAAAQCVGLITRLFRNIATSKKNDPRFERIAMLFQNSSPVTRNSNKSDTPGVWEWSSSIPADRMAEWFAPFLANSSR